MAIKMIDKIKNYIPLLQEAKENNGYLNLNHITLEQLLFLLRHGYLKRDNGNRFILSSKAEYFLKEYERKYGGDKRNGKF